MHKISASFNKRVHRQQLHTDKAVFSFVKIFLMIDAHLPNWRRVTIEEGGKIEAPKAGRGVPRWFSGQSLGRKRTLPYLEGHRPITLVFGALRSGLSLGGANSAPRFEEVIAHPNILFRTASDTAPFEHGVDAPGSVPTFQIRQHIDLLHIYDHSCSPACAQQQWLSGQSINQSKFIFQAIRNNYNIMNVTALEGLPEKH